MTDFDADEKVPPLKPGLFSRGKLTDYAIAGGGVALALMAAFFPWYVFFNEDQFTYRAGQPIASRDLPELPARPVVNAAPSAIPDSDAAETTVDAPDPLTTATVPEEKAPVENPVDAEKALEQPLPRNTDFRLLHVANGQALIEFANGIYVARTGERLPDDSVISTMEQRDGTWVIVTDKGTVIPVQSDDARP